mgnify:CR=1 FL=1
MEFGLLNLLFAVGLTFLLTVGLMYSVSENDNPTPTQIKNRIVCRRRWRKIKKALTPDEVVFPFLMGILIIGLFASFLLYTGVR